MPITTQDVIKVNIVLPSLRLLGTQEEFDAFKLAIHTEVEIGRAGLYASIQTGLTEPGITLTLNRERLTLDLTPLRTTVNRDYPSRADLSRLADVTWQSLDSTSLEGQQLQAYGFNIEMVLDQDSETSALAYLSRRLFDVEFLGGDEWRFAGGEGRLIFDEGARHWTIALESRHNDHTEPRVFLSVNLHVDDERLPDKLELATALEDFWDEVEAFIQRMDQKGA